MRLVKYSAALALALAFGGTAQAQNLELALAIDGSGSISSANFALQRNAYANVLSDLTVLPRNGSVAIGVYQFSSSVQTVFAMQTITAANHGNLIAAIAGMTQLGGATTIAGAINTATADIFGNGITSTRQLIDVSTDGINNVGDLNAAKANALAAGIDAINCIGIGAGAQCGNVQAGAGAFSLAANDFGDFEVALRQKIVREVSGVPEPTTWAMMLLGFAVVGAAMRRKPKVQSQVRFAF